MSPKGKDEKTEGSSDKLVKNNRSKTGIEGLDKILAGGIPIGNTVLVTGACGTGKTTLSIEFLVSGAAAGETSVFLAVTEPASRVLENIKTYEFFNPKLVDDKKLQFVDMDALYESLGLDKVEFTYEDISALLKGIMDIVKTTGARRLVIDSITGICFQLKTREKVRDFVFKLARQLSEAKCTSLLISEIPPSEQHYSTFGVEDAVADGIIVMGNVDQRGYLLRTLHVVKMRGTTHSRAKYVIDLTPYGIIIVPLLRSTATAVQQQQ
jgi:circadian clock protein KaiC